MPFLLQNQEFHGSHGDSQDDTLRQFYQKLSYFLMTGEHSNKEIMEEIERQISNLQQKVNTQIPINHNYHSNCAEWNTILFRV